LIQRKAGTRLHAEQGILVWLTVHIHDVYPQLSYLGSAPDMNISGNITISLRYHQLLSLSGVMGVSVKRTDEGPVRIVIVSLVENQDVATRGNVIEDERLAPLL